MPRWTEEHWDAIIESQYKVVDPNSLEEYKPTNADRIRSMSDEELAEFFSILDHSCLNGECFICFGVNYIPDNERSILDWLQSEAE